MEHYKKKIAEMLEEIQNEKFLKMLYGFTKSLYNMEKAEA